MIDRETIHILTAQAGVFTYPSHLYPIPTPEEKTGRGTALRLQLQALETLEKTIKKFNQQGK